VLQYVVTVTPDRPCGTLYIFVSLSRTKHPYTTCVSLSLSITTSLPSHLSIFQNALAAPFVRLCRERHREEQRPIENRERVRDRDRSKDRNRGEEGGRERRRRHCDDDHIHIHTHTRTLSLRTCNIACVWVRFYSFEKAKNENSSRPWCTPIYVSLTNTYIQLVLCIHIYTNNIKCTQTGWGVIFSEYMAQGRLSYIQRHTHKRTYTHTCTLTHNHTCMQACECYFQVSGPCGVTDTHAHTHTYTNIYTLFHTHAHTHPQNMYFHFRVSV